MSEQGLSLDSTDHNSSFITRTQLQYGTDNLTKNEFSFASNGAQSYCKPGHLALALCPTKLNRQTETLEISRQSDQ